MGFKKTSIFNFLENANSEVPPQTTWREIQSPNLFQKWVSAPMGGSVLCKHQYRGLTKMLEIGVLFWSRLKIGKEIKIFFLYTRNRR